ncbi:hypothetical protein WMY93_007016 [Mugilogobius chulae]|uniref:Uncharacterized protein n=1 Tax=Mugilogobius chulae TaxID=88201 RepID=A0AAW0PP03_9GOBI
MRMHFPLVLLVALSAVVPGLFVVSVDVCDLKAQLEALNSEEHGAEKDKMLATGMQDVDGRLDLASSWIEERERERERERESEKSCNCFMWQGHRAQVPLIAGPPPDRTVGADTVPQQQDLKKSLKYGLSP